MDLNLGKGQIQISQVLNHKLIEGKPDLALSAHVFWDPLVWNREAEKSVSWVKGASSLPGSAVVLPLTKLSRSPLVSDLVNLGELKLKRALSPLLSL